MNRLIFALIAAFTLTAATLPELSGQPVTDAAEMISPAAEAELNKKLYAYQDNYGHQMAVVTVKSLEGDSIEAYAVEMFRKLRLGHDGSEDGVLLLVAPNDRKVRIENGAGMSTMLTDATSGQIIRNDILPLFKDRKMEEGVVAGVDSIIKVTAYTPAQIEQAKALAAKEEAFQASKRAASRAKVWDFFLTLFGFGALGGAGWGAWFAATMPRRRRELEAAAARAEVERLARAARMEAARQAEIAEMERRQREREEMLAAMTPAKRKAFLAREAAEAAARAAAYAEQRRLQKIEDERRRVAAAAQRAREEEEERNRPKPSYDYGSSDDSSSSGRTFSGFGGGSSGGGRGASGGW